MWVGARQSQKKMMKSLLKFYIFHIQILHSIKTKLKWYVFARIHMLLQKCFIPIVETVVCEHCGFVQRQAAFEPPHNGKN